MNIHERSKDIAQNKRSSLYFFLRIDMLCHLIDIDYCSKFHLFFQISPYNKGSKFNINLYLKIFVKFT